MAEMKGTGRVLTADPGLEKSLDRLDADLDIMERHAAELAEVEGGVQEQMRRWDREFKDSCLHSIPKHRKHIR